MAEIGGQQQSLGVRQPETNDLLLKVIPQLSPTLDLRWSDHAHS